MDVNAGDTIYFYSDLMKQYTAHEIRDALDMHWWDYEKAALELNTFAYVLKGAVKKCQYLKNCQAKAIIEDQQQMIADAQNDLIFYASMREINPRLAFQATTYMLDKLGSMSNYGVPITNKATESQIRDSLEGLRGDDETDNIRESVT